MDNLVAPYIIIFRIFCSIREIN